MFHLADERNLSVTRGRPFLEVSLGLRPTLEIKESIMEEVVRGGSWLPRRAVHLCGSSH